MADAWDTYIQKQQSAGPQPSAAPNPFASIPIFGALFGALGKTQGVIGPDKKTGLYSPSIGPMPVGPPTPINYGAIRNLLSSGALRTGQVPDYQPPPPAAPAPQAPAPKKSPGDRVLEEMMKWFQTKDLGGR